MTYICSLFPAVGGIFSHIVFCSFTKTGNLTSKTISLFCQDNTMKQIALSYWKTCWRNTYKFDHGFELGFPSTMVLMTSLYKSQLVSYNLLLGYHRSIHQGYTQLVPVFDARTHSAHKPQLKIQHHNPTKHNTEQNMYKFKSLDSH